MEDGATLIFGTAGADEIDILSPGNKLVFAGAGTDIIDAVGSGGGSRLYGGSGGDLQQVRELAAGSSFASSESPWPSFGLRDNESAEVVVTWPSGLVESYQIDEVNRIITLTEGEGEQ